MGRSGPGRGGGGWAAASLRPLRLLHESQLAAWLLFRGVTERAEDRGLLRSLSFGGLLVPPSWVWIRAAERGRDVRRLRGGGWHGHRTDPEALQVHPGGQAGSAPASGQRTS